MEVWSDPLVWHGSHFWWYPSRQCIPVRISRYHCGQRFGDSLTLEWPCPRQALVEDATELPDVGTLVDGLPLGRSSEVLRKHEVRLVPVAMLVDDPAVVWRDRYDGGTPDVRLGFSAKLHGSRWLTAFEWGKLD